MKVRSTDFHQQFPALDPSWIDSVVLELVGRGADGPAIGDALAVADAHCADSGETAEEAFGEPRAYAASAHLPGVGTAQERTMEQIRQARPTALGLVGMLLAFRVIDAHVLHTRAPIRVGDIVSAALILAIAVLTVRFLGPLTRRPGWFAVLSGVAVFAALMAPVTLTQVMFTVPVVPAGLVALLAVVVSGLLGRVRADELDPVRDPRRAPAAPGRHPVFRFVTRWLFLIATVVGGGLILLINNVAH